MDRRFRKVRRKSLVLDRKHEIVRTIMVRHKVSNCWGSAPDPEVYRFLHGRAAFCTQSILSKSNVSITWGAFHSKYAS